jgi:hypothetical protein
VRGNLHVQLRRPLGETAFIGQPFQPSAMTDNSLCGEK